MYMNPDITNTTGKFLAILADESHPVEKHCKCGHVLFDPWTAACEVCDPEQLPCLLRQQAA
jgi:hypothetical protein